MLELNPDQLLNLTIADHAYQVLSGVVLNGRFQRASIEGKSVILDVAHNPAASALLAKNLASEPCTGRTLALSAVMADKDVAGLIEPLKDYVDAWFVANLNNNSRALAAEKFSDALVEQGISMVSISKNLRQAFRRALSMMTVDDRLLVFGSFFTVAEVMQLLARDKKNDQRHIIDKQTKERDSE